MIIANSCKLSVWKLTKNLNNSSETCLRRPLLNGLNTSKDHQNYPTTLIKIAMLIKKLTAIRSRSSFENLKLWKINNWYTTSHEDLTSTAIDLLIALKSNPTLSIALKSHYLVKSLVFFTQWVRIKQKWTAPFGADPGAMARPSPVLLPRGRSETRHWQHLSKAPVLTSSRRLILR